MKEDKYYFLWALARVPLIVQRVDDNVVSVQGYACNCKGGQKTAKHWQKS